MAARKPRKPKNVIKFPKRPVRPITAKGVDVANPYEQFAAAVNCMAERDGFDVAYHRVADAADQMRRVLAKQMFMRSSG